jgi:hypothetical protein
MPKAERDSAEQEAKVRHVDHDEPWLLLRGRDIAPLPRPCSCSWRSSTPTSSAARSASPTRASSASSWTTALRVGHSTAPALQWCGILSIAEQWHSTHSQHEVAAP